MNMHLAKLWRDSKSSAPVCCSQLTYKRLNHERWVGQSKSEKADQAINKKRLQKGAQDLVKLFDN